MVAANDSDSAFDSLLDTREDLGPSPAFVGDAIFAATRAAIEPCTNARHEHLKATAWESLTFVGIQGGELEMRNCACGATLCKPLPVKKFWLCRRDHVVRVEFSSGQQSVLNIQDGCIPDLDDEAFERAVWAAWDGDGDERFQGWDRSQSSALEAADAAYDALHGEAA